MASRVRPSAAARPPHGIGHPGLRGSTAALAHLTRAALPGLARRAAVLAGSCALGVALGLAPWAAPAVAQSSGDWTPPERAIRLDLPMTDMIERAHRAGTRDSTGAPGPNYWQLRVDYLIDARLEPEEGTVEGRETILLHNTSPDDLDEVVLRLDQNVFRPNVLKSRVLNDVTEGTVVTALSIEGEPVDLAWSPPRRRGMAREPLQQSYVRGLESTSATLVLAEPIRAGETATLEVAWRFEVPVAEGGRGLRMGAWGDSLFQIAQWYPRVAKYDDLRGWDTEPYLGSSEFYNNFGAFDVRIDVPEGWVVGATGVLQNPEEVLTSEVRSRLDAVLTSDETRTIVGAEEFGPGSATRDVPGEDGRLIWRFTAEQVNDFAWATSDRYVWEATRVAIPGADVIPFSWMYLPGNAARFEGADRIGRHALRFYSELWMPYAFPQLTMVDGPDTGMEYPMFIMSATGAEDHEIGHEWWPMMVGTNETWYGFMDEGFNQYMGTLSRADARGEDPARALDGLGQAYGRVSGNEREAPLMWNANYGGPMYSYQAYSKAPLMLSMLGGVVGDEAVWDAMADYARTWRFKHPSPWDYAFFMNRALERDLDWFWYSWLFTTESVDGAIQEVVADGGRATVTVRQNGQMPAPVVLRVDLAEEGPPIRPMANAEMVEGPEGAPAAVVRWPVDVWFPGSRTFEAELDFGGRAITGVVLDPYGRFPDGDPSDNAWRAEVASGAR